MAKNLVNKAAANKKASTSKAKKTKAQASVASTELDDVVLQSHQVTPLVENALKKDFNACLALIPGCSFDDAKHTLCAKVQAGLIKPSQLPS